MTTVNPKGDVTPAPTGPVPGDDELFTNLAMAPSGGTREAAGPVPGEVAGGDDELFGDLAAAPEPTRPAEPLPASEPPPAVDNSAAEPEVEPSAEELREAPAPEPPPAAASSTKKPARAKGAAKAPPTTRPAIFIPASEPPAPEVTDPTWNPRDAAQNVVAEMFFASTQGRTEEVTAVLLMLPPEDIIDGPERLLYSTAASLHEDGRLNLTSWRRAMDGRGQLGKDASALFPEIISRACTSANLLPEASRLKEHAIRQRAIEILSRGLEAAKKRGVSLTEVLDDGAVEFERLRREATEAGPKEFSTFTAPSLLAANLPKQEEILGSGLLGAGGFFIVQGEEKLGKSLLVLDLVLGMARGYADDFLGYFPIERRVRVLYVAAEGGPALTQDRLRTLVGQEMVPEGLVFLFPTEANPDLTTVAGLAVLETAIRNVKADVVVLDPLAELSATLEENDAKAMKVFLGSIKRLQRRTGVAVIAVHHTSKLSDHSRRGSARRGRGSTVLPAFAGAILTLEAGDEGIREATFTLRAGPAPETLLLTLNAETMRFEVQAEKRPPTAVCMDMVVPVVLGAGKEGATYEEIIKSIKEATGQKVSERKVRDALTKFGEGAGLERFGGGKAGPVMWRGRNPEGVDGA